MSNKEANQRTGRTGSLVGLLLVGLLLGNVAGKVARFEDALNIATVEAVQ